MDNKDGMYKYMIVPWCKSHAKWQNTKCGVDALYKSHSAGFIRWWMTRTFMRTTRLAINLCRPGHEPMGHLRCSIDTQGDLARDHSVNVKPFPYHGPRSSRTKTLVRTPRLHIGPRPVPGAETDGLFESTPTHRPGTTVRMSKESSFKSPHTYYTHAANLKAVNNVVLLLKTNRDKPEFPWTIFRVRTTPKVPLALMEFHEVQRPGERVSVDMGGSNGIT
ncbi:uncharacterized protein HD556DRAFT_1310668 [Suillus plorans]|uniref:Uncharacterized protein n=1 Tax=Suillus plorans TaxID=116603 RepID=A0A9P7AKM5_9AGAM|nr:uncharacterized protein HD556DRAFT_1310668 [Suillus plorans]KAG1790465.1 hypothetical protein HD556DRAFT_1310668 [Suillus plorans]